MPEYDGSIIIDTHIDTSNFDKDANTLFNKASKISDKLSSSIGNTKIGLPKSFNVDSIASDISKLPANLQKLEIQIFNTTNAIDYLKNNFAELSSSFGGDVLSKIESLGRKLSDLTLQKQILSNTPTIGKEDISNAKLQEDSMQSVSEKIKSTADEANKTKMSFSEMARELGSNFASNASTAANAMISSFRNASTSIRSNLNNIKQGISKVFSLTPIGMFGNYAKSVFSGIGNSLSKVFARAKFIILGKTIRAVLNHAKESFEDLKTYGGTFANTAQQITDAYKRAGNSIATAFAPVLTALAPIIVKISSIIVDFMNKVSMFTTVLFTGSKTATIANTDFKNYSKSVSKSTKNTKKNTKATKEQYKALAKFDKLDIFKKDKQSKVEAPTVEEPKPQALDMFKTVEVPNNVLEFVDKVKSAVAPLVQEFQYVGNSFMKNFAEPVYNHVKENVLPRFLESTKNAVKNMDFSHLNSSLDHFFGTMSNITKDLFSGLQYGWEKIILPMVTQYVTEDLPNFLDNVADAIDGLHDTITDSKEDLKKFLDFIWSITSPILRGFMQSMSGVAGGFVRTLRLLVKVFADFGRQYDNAPDWLKNVMYYTGRMLPHLIAYKIGGPWLAGATVAMDLVDINHRWNEEARKYEKNKKEYEEQMYNFFDSSQERKNKVDELIKKPMTKKFFIPENLEGKEYEEYLKKFKLKPVKGHATGTVVSPSHKYLAMLGDNNYEPEVVSPISTMKRAFTEAMGDINATNTGNITLQIDGKTFARLINPYMDSEKNRIGISMVQGVY